MGFSGFPLACATLVFGPLPGQVPPLESRDPCNVDYTNLSDADRDTGSMSVSGARSSVRGSLTGPRLRKGNPGPNLE